MGAVIVAGLKQQAKIFKIGVPQAATGRYDVIGQDDGRSYSAPYEQSPKTGIYSSPTLFAETGNELIVDPATTRNIQMNYPGIMEAINAARVPQRAAGNYQPIERSQPAPAAQQAAPGMDEDTLKTMREFNGMLKLAVSQGIAAKLSLREIDDKIEETNRSKNNVKR
jgi:hypothetical protein